jgi:DNA repair protein RecO (recombination protein O)
MVRQQAELHPCFVLHQKPYRETSLLLDVFSQHFGRSRLIARGSRTSHKKSVKHYQLFKPLLLSWSGYGELQTVSQVEENGASFSLKQDASLCGLYLNELLVRLLPLNEPEPALFETYQHTLSGLQLNEYNEWLLRLFEKQLLQQLGYGLDIETEAETGLAVDEQKQYYYQANSGLLKWTSIVKTPPILVRSLILFANNEMLDANSLKEIKTLMRGLIQYYLGDQPLRSRQLFAEMQRYADKQKV